MTYSAKDLSKAWEYTFEDMVNFQTVEDLAQLIADVRREALEEAAGEAAPRAEGRCDVTDGGYTDDELELPHTMDGGNEKLWATVQRLKRERDQARDALEVARRVWAGLEAALTGFMRKS